MTKINYIATDANGTVHTRSTASRAYTHTVVVKRSKQGAIAQANAGVAHDLKEAREQFAFAAQSIEQIKAGFIARKLAILARDDEYATKRQIEGKAFVAQWGTPEAYAAAQHVQQIAKIEATDWNVWFNVGWCGRADLAAKLAAQQDRARYSEVAILPATEKQKKAA